MEAATLNRISDLKLLFPIQDEASRNWFTFFVQILGQLKTSVVSQNELTISPIQPQTALPLTSFGLAEVVYPQLILDTADNFALSIGEFLIANVARPGNPSYKLASYKEQQDQNGPYLVLDEPTADFKNLLPMSDLASRLQGRIVRIDHTGFNVPVARLDKTGWTKLLNFISARTNQYRYPTGEDWPFILPATDAEFESNITNFVPGREPRFELVYDEYLQHPLLQYALVTNLSQAEAQQLFPAPYGMGIPGLDQYFYSVYAAHPWSALSVRFDLYYAEDGSGYNDYQTGEWFVTAGGRLASLD